ncbi:hypothetical protein PSPTOT1_3788 [Pseudomonas syringae pv. tomato T1]|nr:hypothetical protein PSPTOT1_3788 [Pseudomonas syringae pv. tomato T1]
MRNPLPGSVEFEDLANVTDDIPYGFVLEASRQRALHPLLQIKVIDLIDLFLAPPRFYMDFGLVGVPPVCAGCDIVLLNAEP